jgi:ribosomal-protein-alanine N-acetyltransferase
MKADLQAVISVAHISEAVDLASVSRLHVEHGLRWRWTPAKIRQQILDPETMVLVASVRGDIAGFAIMNFGDDHAHLLLLAVQPAYRRCRIGSSLLRWLEESCRTAGIQQIRLELRSTNRTARDFYVSAGFHFLGQISAYYDGLEAASIMAKDLFTPPS